MSSRDKSAKAASGKHRVQTGGKQHQSGTTSSSSSSSKTPNSRTNSAANSSSRGSKKEPAASGKKPPATKHHQKGSGDTSTNHQKIGSPRTLEKFTELEGDICASNKHRRKNSASGGKMDDTRNSLGQPEKFAEQETDVDEAENRELLAAEETLQIEVDDDDEFNESSSFLSSPKKTTTKPMTRISMHQEPATTTLLDDPQAQDPLPPGWEQHSDKAGFYFWHVSTGVIQRTRPSSELPSRRGSSVVVYHDDEEINQAPKSSSDDEDDFYAESGAALTVDDTSESTFVVYPLGCCEFDETQLMSATSSKAIQKCILRLSNQAQSEETVCWGLDQSQPILMKLFDDHIQFTDLKTQLLLRSQPIQTIKTWAVDDNNNFAFVVEDRVSESATQATGEPTSYMNEVDYALLSEPQLMCYVFRSVDEDDMMSCKVAAKLNEEINRYKEQMINRMTKSTRLQQMVVVEEGAAGGDTGNSDQDDADGEDFDEELEASNELTMNVRYIGRIPVPRPTGIEVLNVAIDKCLAEATTVTSRRSSMDDASIEDPAATRPTLTKSATTVENGGLAGAAAASSQHLVEAKLHVSPSSVIVESVSTGEIIVECRIRYLTFMGISKRDIRWCGFIMQNTTNKSFVAHCFECYPTAGHVCEAIQLSCTRMYEKVLKNSRRAHPPETMSIIPSSSKIRNTLAKTFGRIKLNPLR